MAANKFLSTYNPSKEYDGTWNFYVLNKGLNSGKPLKEPCPNCYVFHCANYEQNHYFYWLVYALWQTKAFRPYLHGSVIEYIRIDDANRLINEYYAISRINRPDFEKHCAALVEVQKQRRLFEQQMNSLEETKRILLRKALRVS